MQLNRGLLFWGVALITAGATALAVQQGYLAAEDVAGAWRLWPVILIAIGFSIVLARTPFAVIGTVVAALVIGVAGGALVTVGPSVACSGDIPSDLTEQRGTFAGPTATVGLDFNCGDLSVAMADGTGWTAGNASTGRDIVLVADAAGLSLSSRHEGGWSVDSGRQRWDVGLGAAVTYDLEVAANAAGVSLDLGGGSFDRLRIAPNAASLSVDLAGASVDELELSMNAGSAAIRTDAATALAGSIGMNAGSLELCVPDGAALRITVADGNVTFSHNLDDSGLARSGDTWTSDAFDGAATIIDLRLEGNAASFTLNPDGGCA
jgi:Domain of unknown function (DUF5668)